MDIENSYQGTTGRSFFMDSAVRDLLPLHPKKPSNINQKVNSKLSGNLPGDNLSALFDHLIERTLIHSWANRYLPLPSFPALWKLRSMGSIESRVEVRGRD